MNTLAVKQYTPSVTDVQYTALSCLESTTYHLKPFDEKTINFLDKLSKLILSDPLTNKRAEISALGFWLRRAQVIVMFREQEQLLKNPQFKISPVGKIFHICPANVDTMFVYSMVVGLLMGNKNILRISRRMDSPHVMDLFDKLNYLMQKEEFSLFKNYINIISYEHNDDVSNYLSSSVNARVIWGGDSTIKIFQSFKKAPRTKDVVFADRISMMILNAVNILSCEGKQLEVFLQNFFNDAYTFDQMGCSSPQTIYFLGTKRNCKLAREKLIHAMERHLLSKYDNDIYSLASLKINRMVDDALENKILSQSGNNLFKLLELNDIRDSHSLHGCGGGYFYYKDCEDITNLKGLKDPRIQTISHFGLSEDELSSIGRLAYGEGIDRIVGVGNALNFHYIWDGYNLFDELSRKVYYMR